MTNTDSGSICNRVCKDVLCITPIRTAPDKLLYLAIETRREGTWILYRFADTTSWKYLIKVNSTRRAKCTLQHIGNIHKSGRYIQTYNILNTFKYIYGYKGKYQ